MPLKILHFPHMLLRRLWRLKRAQIPPLAGLFVRPARTEAIFSVLEFPDHPALPG